MSTLFISDLHLDPGRPEITSLFLEFLRGEAATAEALYILGDLFEAWVGDDEDGDLAWCVQAALRQLVEGGVAVFFLRGNRDFLVGTEFAMRTGARLLPDPCVIRLHDQPALLMHGDLLCTDDAAYQAFRAQVRNPAWQAAFLEQPLAARHAYAEQARAASHAHQSGLRELGALEVITDVNPAAVADTLTQFGVTRLIHGHTHRPAIHALRTEDGSCQRIVLGDWHQQGSVLRVDRDGFELATL